MGSRFECESLRGSVSRILNVQDADKLLIENWRRWRPDVFLYRPSAQVIVGEIKSDAEVRNNTWWHDWQNPDIILPGKPKGSTLACLEGIANSDFSRGDPKKKYVAAIMGQLKYSYLKPLGLLEGWLFIEKGAAPENRRKDFHETLSYLKDKNKIDNACEVNVQDGLLYSKIVLTI